METNKKIKIILEKTSTGYSAYAKEHSAIYTSGENIQEIKENIQEVIDYQVEYLEEQGKNKEAATLGNAVVEYYLDIRQFFEEYKFINKSAFAEAIGEKPNYIRKISKGIVRLSDEKSMKIEKGLHKLGKELMSVHFT